MYADFIADNRVLQSHKKTKKSVRMFERELHKCWGKGDFRERYQHRVNGKNVMADRVFMKCRRKAV